MLYSFWDGINGITQKTPGKVRRKLGISSLICTTQRPSFFIKQAYSLFENISLGDFNFFEKNKNDDKHLNKGLKIRARYRKM